MTFPLHDDGEQGPDTDGLAKARLEYLEEWRSQATVVIRADQTLIVELEARIARKDAANEALVAKLGATMADMRSLQRQADNWRAECVRLSAVLVEKEAQLAQRMAMPANALRHGGGR